MAEEKTLTEKEIKERMHELYELHRNLDFCIDTKEAEANAHDEKYERYYIYREIRDRMSSFRYLVLALCLAIMFIMILHGM